MSSNSQVQTVATVALPAPFGRKPHHVSASPDGRFVYVAELGSNVVDIIDTATDQLSGRFSAGWPGSKTVMAAPGPRGDVLYAVTRGATSPSTTLVALDAGTGSWLWHSSIEGDPSGFVIDND